MNDEVPERRALPQGVAAQHRYLADGIKKLRRSLGGSEPAARTLLDALLGDFGQHFALEERLMDRGGYPGIIGHRQEHASFLEKIRAMRARSDDSSSELMGVLADTLHSWFSKHEESSDRQAAEYLKIDEW
jgi:hemerythrin-like metal-binding protein